MFPCRLPVMKKSRMTRSLPEMQHLHQRSPIYPLYRHPAPCGRYFPRHRIPQGLRIPAIPLTRYYLSATIGYTALEQAFHYGPGRFLFYFFRPKAISCHGRYTYVICYTLDGGLHTTKYLSDNLCTATRLRIQIVYVYIKDNNRTHQSIYNDIQTPCR